MNSELRNGDYKSARIENSCRQGLCATHLFSIHKSTKRDRLVSIRNNRSIDGSNRTVKDN